MAAEANFIERADQRAKEMLREQGQSIDIPLPEIYHKVSVGYYPMAVQLIQEKLLVGVETTDIRGWRLRIKSFDDVLLWFRIVCFRLLTEAKAKLKVTKCKFLSSVNFVPKTAPKKQYEDGILLESDFKTLDLTNADFLETVNAETRVIQAELVREFEKVDFKTQRMVWIQAILTDF